MLCSLMSVARRRKATARVTSPLRFVKRREVVEGDGDIWVIGAERLLVNRQAR